MNTYEAWVIAGKIKAASKALAEALGGEEKSPLELDQNDAAALAELVIDLAVEQLDLLDPGTHKEEAA